MRHLRLRLTRLEVSRQDIAETLIESLITIAILGVAVVALLGAILIGIKTSVQHRKHAQAQSELRSWAERISATSYVNCATAGNYGGPGPLPSGLSGRVAAVRYWNSAASKFGPSCGPDSGLQSVTLRMTVADGIAPGFTQDLDVVVRRP